MQTGGQKETVNAWHSLGVRPTCPCCGGGLRRDGYKYTKYKSAKLGRKARRSKHKNKEVSRDTIRKMEVD